METVKKTVLKNIKWLILLLSLVIFIYIGENVFHNEKLKIDEIVYSIVVEQWRNDVLTPIISFITQFGSAIVLISICIISFTFLKNKSMVILMSINLIIVYLLNVILKVLIQRERPFGFMLIDETGYSFPSAHSMVSTAFYGLIIYFVYKNIKNQYLKWTLCLLLGLLIPLIGFSRIYLGVHYTSDVIAGFVIGIAYLIIYTCVISTFVESRKKTTNCN